MSTQMLLKQDSTASSSTITTTTTTASSSQRQQYLLKQDSAGSRQMLIKQESSDGGGSSSGSVSRQESSASLVGGGAQPGAVVAAGRTAHQLRHQDSGSSKHALLSKQDSVVSYIETKRGQLMRQDSDLASRRREASSDGGVSGAAVGGICASGGTGRKALCRQDSVVSFAEPKGECYSLTNACTATLMLLFYSILIY